MKKREMISAVLAIVMLVLTATPAVGQVRLGVRGGLTLGEMRFDRNIIDSDNRIGYSGGLLLDIAIPVIGVGAEVSVMYNHRNNRLTDSQHVYKRHYIDIPVYARYRLPIARMEKVFAPVVFTGPSFAILFDENAPDNYKSRRTYLSWDAGAGFDLFNHLRFTVSYGLGLSKAMKYIGREDDNTGEIVNGKDRYWTVSAAYLF